MFLDKYFEMSQSDGFVDLAKTFKTVILDVVDPILMSFEFNNEVYTIYVLEQKKIKKTVKFLLVKSDYDEIEEILNMNKPLNSLFKNKLLIEERNVDLRNKVSKVREITFDAARKKQYLPSDSFCLDKKYPNKVDLNKVRINLKKQNDFLKYKKEFFETENSLTKEFYFKNDDTLKYSEIDNSKEKNNYNLPKAHVQKIRTNLQGQNDFLKYENEDFEINGSFKKKLDFKIDDKLKHQEFMIENDKRNKGVMENFNFEIFLD